MKINILLTLVLALIPLSGAWAYHPQGTEQMAPMPVQKCFRGIELYRQIFIARAAGLTLEEKRIENDFAIRVSKFIADANSMEFDEHMTEDLDAKSVEVYELPDPQYLDAEWQSDWATEKFDTCVAQIPRELLVPPELLEFMEPLAPEFLEPEDNQLQRMIPEIET
jgi:hypothetical protein